MHYNSKTEKNRNAKADFIAASPLISIVFDFHETLLDCIQEGDIDRLKLAMNKDFDQYQNTVMIDLDVARQVFVHDMSLAYFFAHRGGLSMNIGQKLCYYYHTTMMKARTIPVIQVLLKDMLLDFAWNVRQMRPAQTFPVLIRKCIEYIHAHIAEKASCMKVLTNGARKTACSVLTKGLIANAMPRIIVSIAHVTPDKIPINIFLLPPIFLSYIDICTFCYLL